jgi:hypothetical protein
MKSNKTCMLLLAFALALPSVGSVGAVEVATPGGTIVSGDTTGLLVGPVGPYLTVNFYFVPEIAAEPVALNASLPAASSSGGPVVWGYEAKDQSARILAYTAGPPATWVADCVPPSSINGRGVAYDPVDGNLWYTSVTFPNFLGDGLIHKTTPPQTGACNLVNEIPFADGPGGTIQDDIGAIDIDGESRHIWAAGYKPVTVGSVRRSYLYLVNRNNGTIIRSCWLPFRDGGVGNDTLAYARLGGLPGSGQYILTDAGQNNTSPNRLAVIDTNDCKGGVQVTPVADYDKVKGMTGIDFEWPGLVDEEISFTQDPQTSVISAFSTLFNLGGPPFSTVTEEYGRLRDGAGMDVEVEDVSLCATNARLGVEETCPY